MACNKDELTCLSGQKARLFVLTVVGLEFAHLNLQSVFEYAFSTRSEVTSRHHLTDR